MMHPVPGKCKWRPHSTRGSLPARTASASRSPARAPPTTASKRSWTRAVSSAHQLPPEEWPHRTEYFENAGWNLPLAPDQPWTSGPHEPEEAAHRVLTALRDGRSCDDPYAFHWGTGSFPVPEGRTGTLTVIDPEQCPTDTDM